MACPSPPRPFERSYLSENWGRVRWYGRAILSSMDLSFAKMHQSQEMVIHHTCKNWFSRFSRYSAARSVFKALCGVCEKRNFKEISTNLCLVLFPHTSLQNKQNTHWLRLFSQYVVFFDKIRCSETKFLFTNYQLAEPRIRGKSSRNYLRVAFKDPILLAACFIAPIVKN